VQAIAEANRVLGRAVDGIVNTQNQIVGRVNAMGRRQDDMIVKIKDLVNATREQEILITDLMQKAEDFFQLAMLTRAELKLDILLATLEEELTSYRESLQSAKFGWSLCEMGKVSQLLLPMRIVNDILHHPFHRVDMPAFKYYLYMQVDSILKIDSVVYCVISAPLLDDQQYNQYSIASFPVCNGSKCFRVYHDDVVVYGTYKGDMFYPDQCRGWEPLVCDAGFVYSKGQQPCLHGLITGQFESQKACPITYVDLPSLTSHDVRAVGSNRYLVRTVQVDYECRCDGKDSSSGTMKAGLYSIDIGDRCFLDATIWSIQGLPTFTRTENSSTAAPKILPLYLVQGASLADIPLDSLKIPPGIQSLKFDSFDELAKVSFPNAEETVMRLQKSHTKKLWWLYLSLGLGSCLAIVVGISTCIRLNRYRKHKPITFFYSPNGPNGGDDSEDRVQFDVSAEKSCQPADK
jgi:hypothetical protein